MSNNKQIMKLYTEDQVKLMIDDAHNGVDGYYDILKKHNPIKLPSDEEIEKAYKFLGNWTAKEVMQRSTSFQHGAQWMRDKIQGGNNEQ